MSCPYCDELNRSHSNQIGAEKKIKVGKVVEYTYAFAGGADPMYGGYATRKGKVERIRMGRNGHKQFLVDNEWKYTWWWNGG